MYEFSEKTRENIEKTLGMSIEEFSKMDIEEQREYIEKKNGRPLRFSKERKTWVIGRGNPYLARRKISTAEDWEEKSKRLFGI